MKKMIALLMFVLFAATATACIEDGALPADDDSTDPDAGAPVDDPDARPTAHPAPTLTMTANPATITVGQSTTVNWTSTHTTSCSSSGGAQPTNGSWTGLNPTVTTTYRIDCTGPGGWVYDDVVVVVNPSTTQCNTSCDDGKSWTGDACDNGVCTHWPTDCGGMEVQVPANITGSVSCGFWGGFGVPPNNAPNLGRVIVGSSWQNSPTHSCAVDDCQDSTGAGVRVNIRIQWNGSAFQNQTINNLWKGTWDGHNLQQ